jgi:hypothetical protein
MNGRRLVKAFSVGIVVGAVLVFVIIIGGVVVAVSGQRNVSIPLLMSATSSSGKSILGLAVQPFGLVAWLAGLSFLAGLPLALAHRNLPGPQEADHR